MDYSGNRALSPDARERVLSTFEQTLGLAAQGNRREASLGCDFILQLDPEFEPARVLMARLESGEGPVGVEDLRSGGQGAGAARVAEDPFASADELFGASDEPISLSGGASDLESLDLGSPMGSEMDPREAALHGELQTLLEQHRLEDVLTRAGRAGAVVASSPGLTRLVETARARLEAGPYIASFLDAARKALRGDDLAEAGMLITKAQELDPSHPGVRELEKLLAASAGGSAPAAHPAGSSAPSPPPSSGEADLFGEDPFASPNDGVPDLELSDLPPEEEAPLGSLFGAEPEAPAAAPTSDLGFDRPAGGPEQESDQRIQDFLSEGQESFDRGDYQGAIDAWSRIFLIDIDHEEAARRIEGARKLKAEQERQVEETYHEAVEALDRGDVAGARQAFEQVLSLQPNHLAAREYLQQIEAGEAPTSPPPPVLSAPVLEPPSSSLPASPALPSLTEEILVPPEPGQVGMARSTAGRSSTFPSASPRRTFVLIGSAVLVVVILGGWLLMRNWSRFFPNAPAAAPAATGAPQAALDPIARAMKLHESGRAAMAINQLRRLPPDDAHFEEAQALISQWEAEEASGQEAVAGQGEAPSAADAARREQLLERARQAYDAGEFLLAEDSLLEAESIQPLAGKDRELRDLAASQLEPIRTQVELFRGGDWEFVLPQLWRLHEAQPANHDITRLIVDCYYNLGVRDLQRGNISEAQESFAEALTLQPDDEGLRRHFLFAQTYTERQRDLLYRIYVKYLPFRG